MTLVGERRSLFLTRDDNDDEMYDKKPQQSSI